MEFHSSPVNFGRPGAAGEGLPTDDYATPTPVRRPEDDFECTYFRKRTPLTVRRSRGQFPTTGSCESPSDVSDEYTDSESESDNTSNVERWLESLPTKDTWSSVPTDEQDWRLKKIDETNENCVVSVPSSGARSRRGAKTKEVRFDVLEVHSSGTRRPQRGSSTREKAPFRDSLGNSFADNKSSDKAEDNLRTSTRIRGKSLAIAQKTRAKKDVVASDDVMEELVNRLLTVSTTRRDEADAEEVAIQSASRRYSATRSTQSSATRGQKRPRSESLKSPSRAKAAKANDSELWKVKRAGQTQASKPGKRHSRRVQKAQDRANLASKRKPTRRNRSALTNRLTQQKSFPQPPYEIIADPERFSQTCRRVRFTGIEEDDSLAPRERASRTNVARKKRFLNRIERIVQDFGSHGKSGLIGSSSDWPKLDESSVCKRDGKTSKSCDENEESRGIDKPRFTNPVVEKSFDKAMELAINKYKRTRDSWESLARKKSHGNASLIFYEPPVKKQRARSSVFKPNETIRRDFSALDSWQSVHKHFLSYSSYE